MGLRADSARPQRVSGSARTDSRRAESARNPIASHVKFGDDSALNAFTRTQWTAALSMSRACVGISASMEFYRSNEITGFAIHYISQYLTHLMGYISLVSILLPSAPWPSLVAHLGAGGNFRS